MGFLKIFFKELWAIKPKTVMGIFGGLGIVLIIGLTPVYKNFWYYGEKRNLFKVCGITKRYRDTRY